MIDQKLARIGLSFTRDRRKRASFERQTVLQSVTEFAWFRVNGLQRLKICPFTKFSGSLSTECKWHRAVVELSGPVFFRF